MSKMATPPKSPTMGSLPIGTRLLAAAAAALVMSIADGAYAACDCSTLPTLGRALEYPVMSFGGDINISGSVWASNGNVGIGDKDGNKGKVSVSGSSTTIDNIYYHPGTQVDVSDGNVGAIIQRNLSGAVNDALDASAAFWNLGTTQSFGKIESATTITGNGCINVIKVNGDLSMGDGKLTLRGGPDDYFIFNISGGFSFGGDARVILDGIEPEHVIFNVRGGGGDVSLSGSSNVYGTYLNADKGINVSGDAQNKGAFYGREQVSISGSATWDGRPFQCTASSPSVPPTCPDPRGEGVNIQTPATPPGRQNGNTSFFYSWFNTSTYEGHVESYKVTTDGSLQDKSGQNPVDGTTKEMKGSRTPWWDAGVELRTDSSRKIYSTKGGARVDFVNGVIVNADFGITNGDIPSYPNYPDSGITSKSKLRKAIINYIHGKDAFDLDNDGNSGEMRPFVLGDVFHSNILFVGTPSTLLSHEQGYPGFLSAYGQRQRVAYAGANDALLHAFDAGPYWEQTDPTAWNDGTGEELFGYVPGLLLEQAALTPKTIDENGDRLVPGFVDGNLVAADAWLGNDSGNKLASEWATVLIASFREGGEGYLALDVTRPGATSGDHAPYPKLLWEFSHSLLAKSWSRPVITRIKLKAGTGDRCGADDGDGACQERWVAIFGGGMLETGDPNEDDYLGDHNNAAWEDKSKAVFIVAMDNGDLLGLMKFDSNSSLGHPTMKFSIPSAPGVMDLNQDGYADVVYIGDVGGQIWKWDISAVGVDSTSDGLMDNWPSGRIFAVPPVNMGSGVYHYRQFFHPPTAAYVKGVLHVAFGSGEEKDILYQGDPAKDDENRFYVIKDLHPTGASAFSTVITESNLLDVTSVARYTSPGNLGYFFKGAEGEKFITDTIIFGGFVLLASYVPETAPACGPGLSYFYTYDLENAVGYYDQNGVEEAADRRMHIGTGVPSNPRLSVASDPTDDVVFVTTSEGEVIAIQPPDREPPESSFLYWRRRY